MIGEGLELLVRLQLVASVAILALLGFRRLVRLDPDTRIWLWLIPPWRPSPRSCPPT